MKRTPIRRVSVKRARQLAEYRKKVAAWLPLHPTCEIGPKLKAAGFFHVRCKKVTKHPHHIKGRLGELLCDERYWLASCDGECHPKFVHDNPSTSRLLGLIA